MPAGIDLFRLYSIINRKLRIRQDANAELEVSGSLVVVLDAGTLLTDPKSDKADKNLTAAAGTYTAYFTVPDNKRWRVSRVRRDATVGVTSIHAQVGGTTARRLSADGAGAEALETNWLLDSGDTIGLITTGNAGDTSVGFTILYIEEDMVRGA